MWQILSLGALPDVMVNCYSHPHMRPLNKSRKNSLTKYVHAPGILGILFVKP